MYLLETMTFKLDARFHFRLYGVLFLNATPPFIDPLFTCASATTKPFFFCLLVMSCYDLVVFVIEFLFDIGRKEIISNNAELSDSSPSDNFDCLNRPNL